MICCADNVLLPKGKLDLKLSLEKVGNSSGNCSGGTVLETTQNWPVHCFEGHWGQRFLRQKGLLEHMIQLQHVILDYVSSSRLIFQTMDYKHYHDNQPGLPVPKEGVGDGVKVESKVVPQT